VCQPVGTECPTAGRKAKQPMARSPRLSALPLDTCTVADGSTGNHPTLLHSKGLRAGRLGMYTAEWIQPRSLCT
jgi:hypothetical protein